MHLRNYCFSSRINISNISTTLFKVPMKMNNNTANACTYYEKYNKQDNIYCTRTTYFFIII